LRGVLAAGAAASRMNRGKAPAAANDGDKTAIRSPGGPFGGRIDPISRLLVPTWRRLVMSPPEWPGIPILFLGPGVIFAADNLALVCWGIPLKVAIYREHQPIGDALERQIKLRPRWGRSWRMIPTFVRSTPRSTKLGRRIQRGMLEESVLAAVRLLLNVKLRDAQAQDSNDPREFAVVSAARARRGRRQAVGDLSSIDEMARYATATLSQNDSKSGIWPSEVYTALSFVGRKSVHPSRLRARRSAVRRVPICPLNGKTTIGCNSNCGSCSSSAGSCFDNSQAWPRAPR